MYMWQLGRTTKNHCAERWGAKGERVHYLSRQLLPLVRVQLMSLSILEILCYPAQTGNQSHLGHLDLDFCEKDMAMVPTSVFSLQKRMGRVNDTL